MALLSVHNLGKYFGERCLFRDITFEIGAHDKMGLVGDNGSGKTTLFKILTGDYSADEGGTVFSRDALVGYMEQHASSREDVTLWEQTLTIFSDVMEIERNWEEVNARLAGGESGNAALIERQHLLNERLEAAGGLTYRSRARAVLLGLGFDEAALSQTMASLSGGQRSKAAMARLLLSSSNLLLLDEPTNHLDIPSVEWLEDFLRSYAGAVLLISHDRYFLDRVTNRTMEINRGRFYLTEGNYSVHRALREKGREVAEKHFKTAMRDIRHVEDSIAKLRQFNREKSIRAAESKEKLLDRLKENLETPETDAPVIRFDFSARSVSGNDVLMADRLSMGFPGRPLFQQVSFEIKRKERIFLVGPNGCGKTTLLKILRGETAPLDGRVKLGAKVSVGYYDQTQLGLDDSKTVMDEVWDAYPDRLQTELRGALAAFLFRGDDVFKPVSMLSGGERARLLLLKLMLARDNLLLLDEPTNHLDIASCEALEEALEGYDGTIFIVSHDRYFINRMASRILRLTADGCESYPGDYDAYTDALRRAAETLAAAAAPDEPPAKESAYKLRKERESAFRKLQTRIRRCEETVEKAEQSIARLHDRLSDGDTAADYTAVLELTAELEKQNALLEEKISEWEALQQEADAWTDEP